MKKELNKLSVELKRVNLLAEISNLLPHISKSMRDAIILQHRLGDPDWVIDLIEELNYIKPDGPYFMEAFHGVYLKKGITTKDLNSEKILYKIEELCCTRANYIPLKLTYTKPFNP